MPEEGEFEMDLEVGQQATSRLPAQGEFEMDLELETSPHALVSRDQFFRFSSEEEFNLSKI